VAAAQAALDVLAEDGLANLVTPGHRLNRAETALRDAMRYRFQVKLTPSAAAAWAILEGGTDCPLEPK
jgi:hypothetical protein